MFNLPVDIGDSNEPTDQGTHHIAYAFYPHSADFRKALVVRKAYEFNYPLTPLLESTHGGVLPKLHSFLSAEPESVVLIVVKKAEDSDDTILRFYETSGEDTDTEIRLDSSLLGVKETNLLEDELSAISFRNAAIRHPTSKNEIVTLKVKLLGARGT